ncbi:membrane protein insertase YidC [Bifidobacterium breve]|uniref:membrane protein insertase YidC n=1 Tax=Bifidobacterium breve TaxID=1685 RepID=UPI003CFF2142
MPHSLGIAIMCLVLIIRICLLSLFFSQMRATQRMQVLQPQIQRIQRKYAARKDPRSKEAMQREIMALQQRHNANPLGSCLLSLIQAPILCSLFYTLQSLPASAAGNAEPLSGIDRVMAGDIESSSIFGVRIADSFGTVVSPQSHVFIGVAVALMCLMLFAMQWLLIHRNTPKDAMDSPQFRTQELTAFVFPAIYVVSGGTLPFGVLLYWLTNNLWNFGQTLCQLRWFPAPGSEAGERKAERDHERENRRRAASGLPSWKKSARRPRVRRPTCAASVKSRSPAAIADSARTCSSPSVDGTWERLRGMR